MREHNPGIIQILSPTDVNCSPIAKNGQEWINTAQLSSRHCCRHSCHYHWHILFTPVGRHFCYTAAGDFPFRRVTPASDCLLSGSGRPDKARRADWSIPSQLDVASCHVISFNLRVELAIMVAPPALPHRRPDAVSHRTAPLFLERLRHVDLIAHPGSFKNARCSELIAMLSCCNTGLCTDAAPPRGSEYPLR